MNRNLGIGILVLCFTSSAVNLAWATEVMQVSPVVVQPYEIQELNEQILDRDRQTRDEEIAIQGLIEENNKLTQQTLARQEDEGLAKINQTMLSYRNALLSRDQARILANGERWWPSRYGDLIALTEDADAMTQERGYLENKSGLLTEKLQMLEELKDEMMALNEKLEGGSSDRLNRKEAIIEGYRKIAQEQQAKIRMLVGRLDDMDRKISRFDEIIAQKDRQIADLKYNLARAKSEAPQDQIIVLQLSQKQAQVDLLKTELENRITHEKKQDDSLRWLNQVLAVAKTKAEYYRLTAQQDQIIVRQVQAQVRHFKYDFAVLRSELENKIKELAANHQIRTADLQSRMEELKNELRQKEQQVALLNIELQNKIAQEKDQGVLEYQIRDLKAQLRVKEDQIIYLKTQVQSGQTAQAKADTLGQQLADQQNKADLLKQELDSKTAQADQLTLMMSDYQKKLESKGNANNEELRQVLSYKNYQTQMEGQIADLSARLQEKEAEVVKIKKDIYDLQKLAAAKDRVLQAKELSLSMTQAANDKQAQEATGLRTELALARRQLNGVPGRDEIDFLRTGLKAATLQLKQKDEMLLQVKANADEYAKEFKKQSLEFQSLKVQLQNAYAEITRLKERPPKSAPQENINALSRDRLREKLKQALDEIDEQGRVVNILVDKLHEAGQSVDLTRDFAK